MKFQALLLVATISASAVIAEPTAFSVMDGRLAQVDLATGDVTDLGDLGLSEVGGMTMTPAGDLIAFSGRTDDLWRIDPNTASASRVGSLGLDATAAAGLTIDACGDLWLASGQVLYQVDPLTGAAVQVTALSEEVVGLTSDGSDLIGVVPGSLARVERDGLVTTYGDPIATSPQLALDFDQDGRLWSVYWHVTVVLPASSSLIYEHDVETGAVLGTTSAPQILNRAGWNLAISPPRGVCASAVAVPVSGHGLAALLTLLCLAGIWRLRG